MISCKFENGRGASLRHVVANILILKGNKILLVKRAASLINPNLWGLVGGFVDRDETIEEAALRESIEETGYQIKIKTLLRIADNPDRPKEDRQNISFVYTAKALNKVGERDWESSQIKWFDLNNLPPKGEFAFDHYENIQLYLKYLKSPFPLPVFGKV